MARLAACSFRTLQHLAHCTVHAAQHSKVSTNQATASRCHRRWPAPAAAPTHARGQLPYTCIVYPNQLLCAAMELHVSRKALHNLWCPLHTSTCQTHSWPHPHASLLLTILHRLPPPHNLICPRAPANTHQAVITDWHGMARQVACTGDRQGMATRHGNKAWQ